MATCAVAPADKRVIARRVGRHLAGLHGKRRTYSPPLVKAAMRRCDFPAAWDCWALSLYVSREDFDAYHAQLGETCDYAAMRTEILDAIGAVDPPAFDGSGAAGADGWFDWLDGLASVDIDFADPAA